MVDYVICAVRDDQLSAFNRPFFTPTNGAAIRSFTDEVKRESPDNPMYAHPQDFSLWSLGTWNDKSGGFSPFDVPQLLFKAVDARE